MRFPALLLSAFFLLPGPTFAQSSKQICGNEVNAEVIRTHYCKEFRATPQLLNHAGAKAAETKCIQTYAALLEGVGLICEYIEDADKIAAEANSGDDGPSRSQSVSVERAVALYAKLNEKYRAYFSKITDRKVEIAKAVHNSGGSKDTLQALAASARDQFKKEYDCRPSAGAGQPPALLLAGLAGYALNEQLTLAAIVDGRLSQLRQVVHDNYVGSANAERRSRQFLQNIGTAAPTGNQPDPKLKTGYVESLGTRLVVQGSTPQAVSQLRKYPVVDKLLAAGGQHPNAFVRTATKTGPPVVGATVSLAYRLVVQGELDAGDFVSIGLGFGATLLAGPKVGLVVGMIAQFFETAIRGRLPNAYKAFAGQYLRANPRADASAVSQAFHSSREKKDICDPSSKPLPSLPLAA